MLEKLFWQPLAKLLATQYITRKLCEYAITRPYFHITHNDGSPYMDRWWLMPRCLLAPDENGHLFPKPWVPFKIRLHHIRTEDYDRELHDHPADYRTIILVGGYVEEDIFGKQDHMQEGDTKAKRAENFHRINDVPLYGVLTVFIMGNKRNRWGFLVDGKKIYYKDYFNGHN